MRRCQACAQLKRALRDFQLAGNPACLMRAAVAAAALVGWSAQGSCTVRTNTESGFFWSAATPFRTTQQTCCVQSETKHILFNVFYFTFTEARCCRLTNNVAPVLERAQAVAKKRMGPLAPIKLLGGLVHRKRRDGAAQASQGPEPDLFFDPAWSHIKWTVYRGIAYDISSFIDKHPGGAELARLAVHRDCTALVESCHMRSELVLARMRALPVLQGFPIAQVPRAPYPHDSKIYTTIQSRCAPGSGCAPGGSAGGG